MLLLGIRHCIVGCTILYFVLVRKQEKPSTALVFKVKRKEISAHTGTLRQLRQECAYVSVQCSFLPVIYVARYSRLIHLQDDYGEGSYG